MPSSGWGVGGGGGCGCDCVILGLRCLPILLGVGAGGWDMQRRVGGQGFWDGEGRGGVLREWSVLSVVVVG